ncbi:E3 ubiquitin-protein ligase RNF114 isoform X2 [Rattus norvegicus]|uniref:E3 ubiquitin-protein ligase RNF114 isoform X2 n=1 Tax=Rattus norvegicus TaxID=10116 RepID=UPI002FD7B496
MAAAQPESRDGAAQSAKPASETDPLSRFTCPVCLEVFEKPVQVPCGHVFCSACLQECLKPKKPVCGVCRSALAPGVRAAELERQIESIETSCHGCRKDFVLSKIRAHVASCSKYQSYIMEGVKATTKDASLQQRNVPNRYTFPCPYCPEKNFDQEGLVEHCKLTHSTDTKSVVCPICASMPWGDPSYRSANFMEHIQRRHRFSYDTFVVSLHHHGGQPYCSGFWEGVLGALFCIEELSAPEGSCTMSLCRCGCQIRLKAAVRQYECGLVGEPLLRARHPGLYPQQCKDSNTNQGQPAEWQE